MIRLIIRDRTYIEFEVDNYRIIAGITIIAAGL